MLPRTRSFPGIIAGFFILLVISSAIFSLFLSADNISLAALWQDAYLAHLTSFSIKQALLSSLLSVGFAIPIAKALSHRHFIGKNLLLKLCAITLVLPVLVGVFGLLAFYGKNGLLRELFSYFGLNWHWQIYGLDGILLAHTFFNLPFCVQLFTHAFSRIPKSQLRLANQLGLKGATRFRLLEWPYLLPHLPHALGLVFMLCFTSFTAVMALGGGPQATTIELAIYQAIRFEFDLETGALLAIWQLCLCVLFQLGFHFFASPTAFANEEKIAIAPFIDSKAQKIWDYSWIGAFLCFLLPPLALIISQGLNPKTWPLLTEPSLLDACKNSFFIAISAACLTLFLATCFILTARFWRYQGKQNKATGLMLIAQSILVVPSIVIATGLFLIFQTYTDVFAAPYFLVILVNSLMALSFAINSLYEAAYQVTYQYQSLCETLGIKGLNRLKLIDWQLLRTPLARAFAISFVLSTGDLSAIALVGSQDFQTLPLYLFQLMGSYQMQAAAAASLLLFSLSLLSYSLIETLLKRKKYAVN